MSSSLVSNLNTPFHDFACIHFSTSRFSSWVAFGRKELVLVFLAKLVHRKGIGGNLYFLLGPRRLSGTSRERLILGDSLTSPAEIPLNEACYRRLFFGMFSEKQNVLTFMSVVSDENKS